MAGKVMLPEREWVSFRDPDDDHVRYTFDVSFLLSGYHCIYGAGCEGIDGDPEVGCCAHGAYLNEDDDEATLQRLVDEDLDDSVMQFHDLARQQGCTELDGDDEVHTRTVDGACIFLNRSSHPAGAGCALHQYAVGRGEHHMTHKPQVCWQLPLHRTIDEQVDNDGATLHVHTIAAFERGHWGTGGADFAWYCTDDDAAFGSRRPVYRDMEVELRAMVGDAVYDALARHLDRRRRQRNTVRFLPLA